MNDKEKLLRELFETIDDAYKYSLEHNLYGMNATIYRAHYLANKLKQ